MRAPPETADLDMAAAWLAANGLRTERFSKSERRRGKTPDFRIYRGDRHVGFCEVKSPRDDHLDNLLAKAVPLHIVGGVRHDPAFNRISYGIAEASKQFDAVNPDRTLPNILVIVNWADVNNFADLYETLTGYLELEDGARVPTMLKIAEGRTIGERKHRIDLRAWFDGPTKRLQGYIFSRDTVFQEDICSWLGLDPANIRD